MATLSRSFTRIERGTNLYCPSAQGMLAHRAHSDDQADEKENGDCGDGDIAHHAFPPGALLQCIVAHGFFKAIEHRYDLGREYTPLQHRKEGWGKLEL